MNSFSPHSTKTEQIQYEYVRYCQLIEGIEHNWMYAIAKQLDWIDESPESVYGQVAYWYDERIKSITTSATM